VGGVEWGVGWAEKQKVRMVGMGGRIQRAATRPDFLCGFLRRRVLRWVMRWCANFFRAMVWGLAGGVAGLACGCGNKPVRTTAPVEGRAGFAFERPPVDAAAKDAKVAVQEALGKDEWVAPRALGKLSEPVYPAVALAAGAGPVTMGMRVVVDAEGKVADVGPSMRAWSTPTPWAAEFRAAIEAAVAQWRFRPAEVRHFTTVTNAEGSYRSMTRSEKTEWALHVTFSFKAEGGAVVETRAVKGK
jgi:hypothetical protein